MPAKQAWAKRGRQGETLATLQDFIDFLHTGFDDMFEIAAVPESVMARLRGELDGRCPAAIAIEGPEVVCGDIHMTLVMHPPMSQEVERTTIVVRPEGTHDVWDKNGGPT